MAKSVSVVKTHYGLEIKTSKEKTISTGKRLKTRLIKRQYPHCCRNKKK